MESPSWRRPESWILRQARQFVGDQRKRSFWPWPPSIWCPGVPLSALECHQLPSRSSLDDWSGELHACILRNWRGTITSPGECQHPITEVKHGPAQHRVRCAPVVERGEFQPTKPPKVEPTEAPSEPPVGRRHRRPRRSSYGCRRRTCPPAHHRRRRTGARRRSDTIYQLVQQGDLEVVHIGRAARIPVDAVHDYVHRLRQS